MIEFKQLNNLKDRLTILEKRNLLTTEESNLLVELRQVLNKGFSISDNEKRTESSKWALNRVNSDGCRDIEKYKDCNYDFFNGMNRALEIVNK